MAGHRVELDLGRYRPDPGMILALSMIPSDERAMALLAGTQLANVWLTWVRMVPWLFERWVAITPDRDAYMFRLRPADGYVIAGATGATHVSVAFNVGVCTPSPNPEVALVRIRDDGGIELVEPEDATLGVISDVAGLAELLDKLVVPVPPPEALPPVSVAPADETAPAAEADEGGWTEVPKRSRRKRRNRRPEYLPPGM